ncbi:MAG: hypothetical protein QME66_05580, partial [Candidatus Eisenbacteria bacterium]|nr:hypothetical protein [Candidatus Eisenbacteria bacterium]
MSENTATSCNPFGKSKIDMAKGLIWKNDGERARGFTDATLALIKRMERVNLRRGWPLQKEECEAAIAEAYRIAGLSTPKFDWRFDVTDTGFGKAAGAAGASGAARAAWA